MSSSFNCSSFVAQILSIPLIWFLIALCTVFSLIPDVIMKCLEDTQLSGRLWPAKLTMYVNKGKEYNGKVVAHLKKPTRVASKSGLAEEEAAKARMSSIDLRMFQKDRSVLSSNNIEIVSKNQETSSF